MEQLRPTIYSNKEKGEERHSILCDYCGKLNYPDHRNPALFYGFQCQDTGMFIGFECKKSYYKDKNMGRYGDKQMHKISEVPVMVPQRKIVSIQLEMKF